MSMVQSTTVSVPMDRIKIRDDWNLRGGGEHDVDSLADSMARSGQLHALVVNADYELLAGHRRFQAAQQLGWEYIEVKTIDLDEDLQRLIHLDENLERHDLSIPRREEALAEKSALYQKLVSTGVKSPGDFRKETEEQTGLSKTAIYRGVQRHSNASDKIWDSYKSEDIGSSQLDELIKLPTKIQDKIIGKVKQASAAETRQMVNEELAKINVPKEFAVKHPTLGTLHAEKAIKMFTKDTEKVLEMLECLGQDVKGKVTEGEWKKVVAWAADLQLSINTFVF